MDILTKEKIKEFKKLQTKKYRQIFQSFIVEGHHLVQEALKTQNIQTILSSSSDVNYPNTIFVNQGVIQQISSQKHPQNVLAICHFPQIQPLDDKIILLDNVQDPGNVGTILRNAYAFGFKSVVVQGVDIYNPKTIQASQGAIFHLNVQNIKDTLSFLQEHNDYQIIATALTSDAIDYSNLEIFSKYIVIFGNEGQGITKNILNLATNKVIIPIEFESLNVAVASGIILNNLYRRKNEDKK